MTDPEARRAAIHTGVFYAALFGGLGAHLPFWPVWLEDWGLDAAEIGVFTSLGVAVRVVAGLAFPVLADRLDRRRATLAVLAAAGAAVFAAHAMIGDRLMLALGTMATGAAIAGIIPIGEALGAGAARRHGFTYARPRAMGSVAFLLASLVVGWLIARMGAGIALWWIVAFMLLTAALALRHPGAGTVAGAPPPGLGEVLRLFTSPTFALFTLAAGFSLSSHAVYYAYGSVHWRSLGLSEDLIGALWAFSVAVEVVFMLAYGPTLIARAGAVGALAISAVGGVLRWGAMAFDPGTGWLWVLQILHTASFVCGHLGAVAFISIAVPDRYTASAQGAFMGLVGGVLTAAGMTLAAVVYPRFGGGTYLLAAGMSAVGLGLAIWLGRRWDGRELDLGVRMRAGRTSR